MAITVWPIDAKNGAPQYAGRGLRQTTVGVPLVGATAARPLGVRSGVRPGTPSSTVAVSGSTVTVRPHAGVLDVQAAVEASGYEYASDANVNVTTTFTQDQSNPRTDITWVQATDPSEGNGGAPSLTFGYTAGTAAGSPTTPALPPRAMLLATLNVPKAGAGSPSVTWVAPTLAAAGGVLPVRSVAELNAVTGSAGAYADLTANADDSTYGLGLYRFTGSSWQPVTADSGWQSLPGFSSTWTPVNNPAIRKVGSQVFMRGQVSKASINGGDGIFTFTSGWRPAQDTYINVATVAGSTLRIRIYANGRVEANAPTGTPTYAIFDGVSFLADA